MSSKSVISQEKTDKLTKSSDDNYSQDLFAKKPTETEEKQLKQTKDKEDSDNSDSDDSWANCFDQGQEKNSQSNTVFSDPYTIRTQVDFVNSPWSKGLLLTLLAFGAIGFLFLLGMLATGAGFPKSSIDENDPVSTTPENSLVSEVSPEIQALKEQNAELKTDAALAQQEAEIKQFNEVAQIPQQPHNEVTTPASTPASEYSSPPTPQVVYATPQHQQQPSEKVSATQVKSNLAELGSVYFPAPTQTVTSASVTSDQYRPLYAQTQIYSPNSPIKNTGNCSLVTGHCNQVEMQIQQTFDATERQFNESDFSLGGNRNSGNVSSISYLPTTGEVEAATRYTSAWGMSGKSSPKFYITLKEPLKNNFGRAAVPKGSLLVATLDPNADPGMVVLKAEYFEVGEQQIPIPQDAVHITSANGTPLVAKFESQNTQSFFQLDWQKLSSIGAIAADLAGVQQGATSILAAGNLLTRQQQQQPTVPPVSYYLLEEGRELKVKITKRIPLPSLVKQQKGNK